MPFWKRDVSCFSLLYWIQIELWMILFFIKRATREHFPIHKIGMTSQKITGLVSTLEGVFKLTDI